MCELHVTRDVAKKDNELEVGYSRAVLGERGVPVKGGSADQRGEYQSNGSGSKGDYWSRGVSVKGGNTGESDMQEFLNYDGG